MPTITFKTKIQGIRDAGTMTFRDGFQMPRVKKNHCDMAAFRKHGRYGAFANSDMFESMIKRALPVPGKYVWLDALPEGFAVDTSGFLAEVTVNIP